MPQLYPSRGCNGPDVFCFCHFPAAMAVFWLVCALAVASRLCSSAVGAGRSVGKSALPRAVRACWCAQHVIRSPSDGVVKAVLFGEGALVGDGQSLVEFEQQQKK
jgi:hypothetical protein